MLLHAFKPVGRVRNAQCAPANPPGIRLGWLESVIKNGNVGIDDSPTPEVGAPPFLQGETWMLDWSRDGMPALWPVRIGPAEPVRLNMLAA